MQPWILYFSTMLSSSYLHKYHLKTSKFTLLGSPFLLVKWSTSRYLLSASRKIWPYPDFVQAKEVTIITWYFLPPGQCLLPLACFSLSLLLVPIREITSSNIRNRNFSCPFPLKPRSVNWMRNIHMHIVIPIKILLRALFFSPSGLRTD